MELIRHKAGSIVATTTLTDLKTISQPGRITAAQAIEGTNVQAALKTPHAAEVRASCIRMIFEVIQFLDCKKTLSSDDEVIFTYESLIDDFPAFRLTEWKYVTDGMKAGKYGKYYERLKAQEFREAFISYESDERAGMLEQKNRSTAHYAVDMPTGMVNMMKDLSSALKDPQRRPKHSERLRPHIGVDEQKLNEIKKEQHAKDSKEVTAPPMDPAKAETSGTTQGKE